MKILVINPGSTSTKIAVYEAETPVYAETINHTPADLAPFDGVLAQLDYRLGMIRAALDKAGYNLTELDAVSARGGFTKPVVAGTYRIDEDVVDEMQHKARKEHAANLGSLLAWELTKDTDIPAYFVDPVSVDELPDVARVTGFAEMERVSFVHALNHRSMARKAAGMLGKTYQECNFVVAHLGGGVTTAAHQKGRMVEVNNVFDEGCFSMDRAGNLPVEQVVDYCFSSGKTKAEILRQLETNSGVVSYLGTRDFRDVERMAFEEGSEKAKLIFDAMVYQLSRDIGSMSAVLHFNVDAIVLTGGMANFRYVTENIIKKVDFIAPVEVLPGEFEMEALAEGAIAVLNGEEEAKEFNIYPVAYPTEEEFYAFVKSQQA